MPGRVHTQIKISNISHCLADSTTSELMKLSFPKISEEKLFSFEYSDDEDVFMACVKRWSNILELNWSPSGMVVSEEKVVQTLRPFQNTRRFKPFSRTKFTIMMRSKMNL
jgi:hypothetical protein